MTARDNPSPMRPLRCRDISALMLVLATAIVVTAIRLARRRKRGKT